GGRVEDVPVWSKTDRTVTPSEAADILIQNIINHAARWLLEDRDIFNPYSGITNNMSESLNSKIKRLIDYKQRALDDIVLYLYYSHGNDLKKPITNKTTSETTKQIQPVRSQCALAERVIEDNGIVFVPQMGAFMVNGSKNEKYSVSILPKEKCSCPATSRCYHIIAALKSIGMEIPDEKRAFNLTQLRKNCRRKSIKKVELKKDEKGLMI
ncbi:hypothetical protein MAR_013703, partial [Mya arenaria]